MFYLSTTATKKLLALTKRIRGIAGGTSASKTISILLILIQYAMKHKNQVISVVSESMPHLRKGAMRDFINILQTHNYYKDARWNSTNSVYTFETNSIMEFFGVESWEKVKGARRDVLFINEANHISSNGSPD
jgi:phage terminase large subunit